MCQEFTIWHSCLVWSDADHKYRPIFYLFDINVHLKIFFSIPTFFKIHSNHFYRNFFPLFYSHNELKITQILCIDIRSKHSLFSARLFRVRWIFEFSLMLMLKLNHFYLPNLWTEKKMSTIIINKVWTYLSLMFCTKNAIQVLSNNIQKSKL